MAVLVVQKFYAQSKHTGPNLQKLTNLQNTEEKRCRKILREKCDKRKKTTETSKLITLQTDA